MSEVFSSGYWKPLPGQEEEFIAAWKEFAGWASGLPGAGHARLTRQLDMPDRFVSFLDWESTEAMQDWKGHAEFPQRMALVQQHVDQFSPSELETVAECEGGSAL
ncbi:MAG TPA: antibiotic biosynthesis monooxygenase family protein [Solirubrobacterales bacterium]|nr:antibiotic biosynthesis monooxygenase family protein [Solirubrobacterales bacterium]